MKPKYIGTRRTTVAAGTTHSRLPFLGWLIGQEKQLKQSEILLFIQVDKI